MGHRNPKKTLDNRYSHMIISVMLARQITLQSSPNQHNSFASMFLEPLCSLFATLFLCFQRLAASFRKTPGWGVPCRCRSLTASRKIFVPCKLFRINTCKSVSKQTTLTTFRMNTYEKTVGRGRGLF